MTRLIGRCAREAVYHSPSARSVDGAAVQQHHHITVRPRRAPTHAAGCRAAHASNSSSGHESAPRSTASAPCRACSNAAAASPSQQLHRQHNNQQRTPPQLPAVADVLNLLPQRLAAAALAALMAASSLLAPPAALAHEITLSRAEQEYEAQLRRKGIASVSSTGGVTAGTAAAAAARGSASSGGGGAGGVPRSRLPSLEETDALMAFDRDLFTDDGWEGMRRWV